jgi:acyl-homoserine-lactone acylase
LANPHLPWNEFFLFFEAQLITNENSLYGATLIGIPVIAIGFNENLGWTHTVNPIDNVDLYELNSKDDKFELDGGFEKFDIDSVTIVKNIKGEKQEIKIAKKRSQFGMIIKEDKDKALALTWSNMDGKLNPFGQWERMGAAKSLKQFKKALNRNELPLFNVIYGDKDDNVLYQFAGNVPKKNGGWDKWQSIVPTASSDDLWKGFYSMDELPGYINPESNWIQNTNDSPYTSTIPSVLNPEEYASHISSNFMFFRSQHSAILLNEAENLTFDEFVKLKHDTHSELALRLKDEIEELKKLNNDSLTSSALEVLSQWDTQFNANSKGAVLFINLINKVDMYGSLFSTPWVFDKPLSTPDGIRNKQIFLTALKAAAEELNAKEGSISVSYGELYRIKAGKYEFPGNGGPGQLGIFRTMQYIPGNDGKFYAYHGDSYVCATEFGKEVKAKAVLYYGNATQPNNIHIGDQLKLYTEKQLRGVWYKREQQEANLELKENISDM